MSDAIFSDINKIIERDSKATTYKFALLRGVIEIIQDRSPYIFTNGDKVTIPTGLLIEKWLIYYYPVLAAGIPQINGATSLAFSRLFKTIIHAYEGTGGYSKFCHDIRTGSIPPDLTPTYRTLCKQLYKTITGMPMKHIGFSLNNRHYSVFTYTPPASLQEGNKYSGLDYLVFGFGSFTIPRTYFDAFRILGSFINGQDSLLFKWAEFSVKASAESISPESVIAGFLKGPVEDRENAESGKIFAAMKRQNGQLFCVWSGKPINHYVIDHMIPFAVWRNNDLWNLLPADPIVNNKKRDKIPAIELIETRKDLIVQYWRSIHDYNPGRFQRELRFSLLGNRVCHDWENEAFDRVKDNCRYLINERGHEEWKR